MQTSIQQDVMKNNQETIHDRPSSLDKNWLISILFEKVKRKPTPWGKTGDPRGSCESRTGLELTEVSQETIRAVIFFCYGVIRLETMVLSYLFHLVQFSISLIII